MKKQNKFWSQNFMAEFKKWMDDHQDNSELSVGNIVNTGLKLKTLIERMDCQESYENSVIDVAKHFLKNGGKIIEIKSENETIQNKKGIFVLNREDILKS